MFLFTFDSNAFADTEWDAEKRHVVLQQLPRRRRQRRQNPVDSLRFLDGVVESIVDDDVDERLDLLDPLDASANKGLRFELES